MSPALVIVGVLALAGCTPDNGPGLATVVPSQPPAATTASAAASPSEEPLLVEARDVYRRYLDTSEEILKTGVIPDGAYENVATVDAAAVAVTDAQVSLAQGYRAEGRLEIASFEIVDRNEIGISALSCNDSSGVALTIDGVPQETKPPQPRLVTFLLEGGPLIAEVGAAPESMGLEC